MITFHVAYTQDAIQAIYHYHEETFRQLPIVEQKIMQDCLAALQKLNTNIVKFNHDDIDQSLPIKFFNSEKICSLDYDGDLSEDISVEDIESEMLNFQAYLDKEDWEDYDPDKDCGYEHNFHLRWFDGSFEYHTGCNQFITDYRGSWASTMVTPFDEPDTIKSMAFDILSEIIQEIEDVCFLELI